MYHIWLSLYIVDVLACHWKKWLHRRLILYLGNLIYTPFYIDVSLQRIMTVMKRCNWRHMYVWFVMTIQLFHFISSIYLNLIFVNYLIFGSSVYFWDVFRFSFIRATRPIPPWRSWAESRRLGPRVFKIWSQKMNHIIYITASSFSLFCVYQFYLFFAHFPVFIIIWKSFITKQIFGSDISFSV